MANDTIDIFPASDASLSDDEEDSSMDLCVVGYASRVFSDEITAVRIDANEHMHCWNNDMNMCLLVDRYDVRCLLDDEVSFARAATAAQSSDFGLRVSQRKMLDFERYRDLTQQEEQPGGLPVVVEAAAAASIGNVGNDEGGANDGQHSTSKCNVTSLYWMVALRIFVPCFECISE